MELGAKEKREESKMISIQLGTRDYSQGNKARKRNRKHTDRKEEITLSPFPGTQLSTQKIPRIYTKVTRTDQGI